MSDVQIIEKDGRPLFYVVPASLWERVREAVEDAEDAAAYQQALAQDDGVRYPAAVAHAIAQGTHPVKAWREHRKLTQDALALACGVSKPFVSQIEGGKRQGTTTTLRKLAAGLGVPIDALTP